MNWLKKYSELLTLSAILLLAIFLRFYTLSEIPNGLYVDEAAIGYNAYSIVETGNDEYGKSFPIILRSYTMFAPTLYTYLSTIPISIFGLSVFSVRFISALSGVISTIVVYFICKHLHVFRSKYACYGASFLLAISPWSVFFSRGAFEANLAFLLLLLGILFGIRGKKKTINLIFSFAFLSLSTYAYHANRLLAPIIVVFLLIWLFGLTKWRRNSKNVIISVLTFAVIQIPYLSIASTEAFRSRANGLLYTESVEQRSLSIAYLPKLISFPLAFVREFFSQYTAYLSPGNLFFRPESDLQRSIPELSVWYSWMVIPYFLGLYLLAKRYKERNIQFVLFTFFVFPIPAALTGDPFSSLRALSLILPMVIILSLGTEYIFEKLPLKIAILIGIGVIFLSGVTLWRSYFVLFPKERASIWNYGYEELAHRIQENPNVHFLIDQSRIKPAYILLAFHMKTPPQVLQDVSDQSIKNDYYNRKDFNPDYSFANLEIRGIKWEEDIYKEQVLVGDQYAISEDQANEHHLNKVLEIEDPLHETVFVGYQTDPKAKCESILYKNEKCQRS